MNFDEFDLDVRISTFAASAESKPIRPKGFGADTRATGCNSTCSTGCDHTCETAAPRPR